jgi:hypothetical protein
MKKKIILLLGLILLAGCEEKNIEKENEQNLSFVDITWTRDASHDEETIKFNSNGEFHYSCACGNPVNDADLCETFTYDENTKEIKLDCFETTEDTITTIKVLSITKTTLELDFDGEIRKFTKGE